MEKNIGNAFLCLSKNCTNVTALVQDMDEIEQHPSHQLVKILNLKNQLNDAQHPLNKYQQFNREKIVMDIDAKIQEIITFSNELIKQFEQEMKKIANDTIELFDNQNYLINAVINLQAQTIVENSKAIQKLFNLDLKEIEFQLNQATKMKNVVDEQTDQLKQQMKQLFQTINFKKYQQVNQVFRWSQEMKNKEIEIKDNTAIVGERNALIILMEPRIDFYSTQSCRVKFADVRNYQRFLGAIILADYNIIKQNNPEYVNNKPGLYNVLSTGCILYQQSIIQAVQNEDTIFARSFEFAENDIIEMTWDGSRRVFGIKKIGTDQTYQLLIYQFKQRFEMDVEFTENSQLHFGVRLYKSDCSLE